MRTAVQPETRVTDETEDEEIMYAVERDPAQAAKIRRDISNDSVALISLAIK